MPGEGGRAHQLARLAAILILLMGTGHTITLSAWNGNSFTAHAAQIQDIHPAGSGGVPQNGPLQKVEPRFKAYVVNVVRFGWDVPADPGQFIAEFKRIVASELGPTVTVKSYEFRPRNPSRSYDENPAAHMMGEVLSLLPANVASTGIELVVIMSSMYLPVAQQGSEAYFMQYVSSMGVRNVAILWGRDARAPWFPASESLLPYILAHEFGHFLGYLHENDSKCIMFPSPVQGASFRNCLQYPGPGPAQAPTNAVGQAGAAPALSSPANNQCIIATTAFGSELAPPVAFLRGFRDGRISSTPTGRGFIGVFNGWYYSFSPYVATLVGGDVIARESTKAGIYPLIGILSTSAKLQPLFGDELGILMAGAFAAFALGFIYFGPIAALVTYPFAGRIPGREPLGFARNPLLWATVFLALASRGWLAAAGGVALVLILIAVGAAASSMAVRRTIALVREKA